LLLLRLLLHVFALQGGQMLWCVSFNGMLWQ